jgi:hypothetical protein
MVEHDAHLSSARLEDDIRPFLGCDHRATTPTEASEDAT